ncbi:hypothetical protein PtrSN002B_007906 [Pyrenophora tritici-repentis]|uniref:Uncharacterized protein n=2 Tax=Pyrenophora tritici-repentis TaxID=45151 RepID=A0A2W1E1Y4_9PLEO|nr:uncharacterized protein PTRG_09124 [Pyrenophora tritici-repentis Pt-1C-BFP]KAA8627718.1 hypothetical protein PtrV1_03398 [Pyrenophora tritici-repentis]EDU42175.1 predicted protein [Pyrenophora tritici-repentis Pt-1C-BFP]KAF7442251.1 hypothetical protein A1F99_131200 [Pyrenophora tritici-repentis]KAF7579377.1 hypothetical protein PtrM4_036170 [Pyrenophora tritici-repentis]KAG9378296.1 hypothetical protein A1F94_011412 [Pyrenophora tritici-repentis]
MALPWVAFDSIASLDGDCANGAEPDIAGIGVVLSFLIASFMTTFASILAMLLDQAFDSKGHFNPRAPLTYLREHFVENQWKKHYAWRPFLDPLIIGFGDQQLVTGYAVLLTGWIKVAQATFRVRSARFVLILYICALSSSSHLAALITLRKYFRKYRFIAKIRIGLVILFAVFLLASMLATIIMPPVLITDDEGEGTGPGSHFQKYVFLTLLLLIFIGVSTALVCILHDPNDRRRGSPSSLPSSSSRGYRIRHLIRSVTYPEKADNGISRLYLYPAKLARRLICLLFLTPSVAFVVQNLLANISAVLVLTQKFVKPKDEKRFCGMQSKEENVWGFGQMLSVVMLLLPILTAAQTYLEARHEILES